MIQDLEIVNFIMELILIVLFGTGLFIALKLVNRLTNYFFAKMESRRAFHKSVIIFELLLWLIYVFWSVDILISTQMFNNPVILTLFAVMFVMVIWFVGRDAFSGLIFRLEYSFDVGKKIITPNGSGQIKKLGIRVLTILSENGQLFYLPYSKIASAKISVIDDDTRYSLFEAQLSTGKNLNPQEVNKIIYDLIIYSPYSGATGTPKVSLIGKDNNRYNFNIIIPTLTLDYFNKIVSNLNSILLQ